MDESLSREIDVEIRLICDMAREHAIIIMAFLKSDRDVRQCVFQITVLADEFINPEITYPVAFDRASLARFCEQLDGIDQRREGTARLRDHDGTTVLCVSSVSRASGQCVVGGRVWSLAWGSEYACEDRVLQSSIGGIGLRGEFDVFVIDRMQLQNLYEGMKRVLKGMR